jgi:hypothetical protein
MNNCLSIVPHSIPYNLSVNQSWTSYPPSVVCMHTTVWRITVCVYVYLMFHLTYILILFSLIIFQVEQSKYSGLNEQLAEETNGLRLCFVSYTMIM